MTTSLSRAGHAAAIVAAGVLMGCSARSPAPEADASPPAPTVADARAFYASQPEYLRPVALGTAVPAGLPDAAAATCGGCHQAIYAEWQLSTHARAWADDAQFQAELHKPRPDDGDVAWMCVNCHTPTEPQLERLVVGLRDGRLDQPITIDNPGFQATRQAEAIGCATCHVRDGVVVGPFGNTQAPHPVAKDESLLTVRVCTRCHQAKAEFPEIVLACAFNTGEEFAAADQDAPNCQHCHMPTVDRPLVPGGPVRTTRRHWFGGSLIPKRPSDEADLAPLRDVFPDGLELALVPLPSSVAAGQTVVVAARYKNAHAGHRLPTGDPERFITVQLTARGPDGAVLATTTARIGTVYRWHPDIEKLSDNRLAPGEERTVELTFVAPAAGAVEITATAAKFRIAREALEYHDLQDRYPAGRTFATEAATVPVR